LLTAISPTILDDLGIFYGRKSVRFSVNGNSASPNKHMALGIIKIGFSVIYLIDYNSTEGRDN